MADMKLSEAVAVLGSEYQVAKVLDINQSAVSRWGKLIPELRARQLQELTDGRLKFDPKQYRKAGK